VARDVSVPALPDGTDVAVAITFDVDAEAGWLGESATYQHRLTTMSEARFGVVRGLPRLKAILDKHDIPATFYIPGDTAERHASDLQFLRDSRHEIAHHGHMHLRSDKVDAESQRDEIDRGLDALEKSLGVRPRGYRSASWELTPETFELLIDRGFDYDSSCMGDDRPYIEEHAGKEILELPVHWSLDDWPHFAWNIDTGGVLTSADHVLSTWVAEFESAVADRRLVTYTMHPEIIGRGYRAAMFEAFLTELKARANVWFARHQDIVDHIGTP
jgi:peptidoglycan/xylan/chitin deacetylase (PgdA/CDA1 family)